MSFGTWLLVALAGCSSQELCLYVPWYLDQDGDGFGDPDQVVWSCEAPGRAVANSDDCDDTHFLVNPDGAETVCWDPVD